MLKIQLVKFTKIATTIIGLWTCHGSIREISTSIVLGDYEVQFALKNGNDEV